MNVFADLHFLRPLWPLAVVPVLLLLAWSASRRHQGDGGWGAVIDRRLLSPLLVGKLGESKLLRRLLAALALVLVAVALAGPSWQKLPQPVIQNTRGLVLVLDLSPSMNVDDVKPNRLKQAKFKLRDVLSELKDRPTALIAFAGSAHVVAPVSNDTGTVANLLRALNPEMMPSPGSRMAAALQRADELLRDGGGLRGDVLLITDGAPEKAALKAASQLAENGHRLTVLGVGTTDGSPIPDRKGGFYRDGQQRIVVAKLERPALKQLAAAGGGIYRDMASDNSDLALISEAATEWRDGASSNNTLRSDGWQDEGFWLLLPVLLLVAIGARKGLLFSWLLSGVLVTSALSGNTAWAEEPAGVIGKTSKALSPLWLNANQRAARALANDKPEAAANLFANPEWQANALYKAGKFSEAADAFAALGGADNHYNRGNALAKSGNLAAAVEAYRQSLTDDPTLADAQANLELVQKLLEQQEQQQEQQNQQGQNGDQQDSAKQSDTADSKSEQSASDDNNAEPGDSDDANNDSEQAAEQQADQQSNQQQNSQTGEAKNSSQNAENTAEQPGEQSPDEQSASEQAEQDAKQAGEEEAQRQAEAMAKQQAEQRDNPRDEQQANEEASAAAAGSSAEPLSEQQQSLQQWLNRIPDDPAGLLRRKFSRQQQREQQINGARDNQSLEEAGW